MGSSCIKLIFFTFDLGLLHLPQIPLFHHPKPDGPCVQNAGLGEERCNLAFKKMGKKMGDILSFEHVVPYGWVVARFSKYGWS